jgi:hypothetical protein
LQSKFTWDGRQDRRALWRQSADGAARWDFYELEDGRPISGRFIATDSSRGQECIWVPNLKTIEKISLFCSETRRGPGPGALSWEALKGATIVGSVPRPDDLAFEATCYGLGGSGRVLAGSVCVGSDGTPVLVDIAEGGPAAAAGRFVATRVHQESNPYPFPVVSWDFREGLTLPSDAGVDLLE